MVIRFAYTNTPAPARAQRFHSDSRSVTAARCLSAGEHPMWVAKQMGHADWTMIARVYGRWMPSADADAGTRAVEKFGGNAGKFAGKSDIKLAKTS